MKTLFTSVAYAFRSGHALFRAFGRRTASTETNRFLPLEIPGLTEVKSSSDRPANQLIERNKPHHLRYSESVDWTSIWPAAATFNHSVVPFPIRQGYCKNLAENSGVSPEKYANAELMKIPNFLHLTKAHIKKHCEALKKLCTEWPSGLKSMESIEEHYPLEVIQRNYVFSASSIRDPRARIVTLVIPLSRLGLDDRAKRKLLRLSIGPGPGQRIARYDYETDELQLTSDRCPTAKQNEDYLKYVLTVLVLESKKVEQWEKGSVDYDWLPFDWTKSQSRRRLLSPSYTTSSSGASTHKMIDSSVVDENPKVVQYRQALEAIWSENDILRRNQWTQRRFGQYRLRAACPPLRDVPFEPIPGADRPDALDQYATATRALLGLDQVSERAFASNKTEC